jgi:tetratricopeptide (TPR) repeat protein
MIHKTFVGRSTELEQIRAWLTDAPAKLVLLTGPGGIGKTSLLSRIEKEYSARQDFIVEYFDLAEQPMTILNQALHLTDLLGRENFPQFTQKLTALDSGLDVSASAGLEEDALNTFTKEVSNYLQSQHKKLLRIIDTFEIVLKYSRYGDDWAKGINEKLKDIPGTFFLIAGREKFDDRNVLTETLPMLEETFKKENILHLPLPGFDHSETEDFFAECDSHFMIPQEMRKKLQLLTDGRPILLSLAVEWLQKDIPLPVLIEKSLAELNVLFAVQDRRDELLNDFEHGLVSKVRQLQTSFDLAALYMAHIDRRMDSRLLSVLLNVDEDKAEENLAELLQFPFVKEFVGTHPKKCALHDEMRALVRKHAWEHLDPSGAEREKLTRKVIEKYYLPRIEAFKKKKQDMLQVSQSTLLQDVESRKNDLDRWLLEAETLSYSLKLGNEEGYKYFDQVYYDEERTPVRDQILIDELKRAGAYDKDKVALRRADELLRRGQREEARRECLAVLKNEKLEDVDRIHGLNVIGMLDFESAPLSAEIHFKKALELATLKSNIRLQIIVHNNLGRLFRNMSRLDESITHLKAALDLARHSTNLEMGGFIRNNLAWTYRLNGDLDNAEALCSLSIAENRKRGQERPLAYAYLTKADIDRNKGDLQSAEQYAKQALDILGRLEDHEGKIQVYRTLANIFRLLYNYEQAFKYLEEGIQLAHTSNSFSLLASLYQLKGRTCRHCADYLEQQQMESNDKEYEAKRRNLFADALDSLQRSVELSGKVGNRWEIARSQLEIILIMLNQQPYDEADLLDRLDQVWNTADALDDKFLKGYVYENHARIEMKNGNYLEAGHDFGQAAYYIANRTGVEMTRVFDRLRNVILDARLKDEQANALAKGVYKKVLEQDDYQDYPKLFALINMCEYILGVPTIGREQ